MCARVALSFSTARDHAAVRMEGKDYVVQEGDVMQIRFNVSPSLQQAGATLPDTPQSP